MYGLGDFAEPVQVENWLEPIGKWLISVGFRLSSTTNIYLLPFADLVFMYDADEEDEAELQFRATALSDYLSGLGLMKQDELGRGDCGYESLARQVLGFPELGCHLRALGSEATLGDIGYFSHVSNVANDHNQDPYFNLATHLHEQNRRGFMDATAMQALSQLLDIHIEVHSFHGTEVTPRIEAVFDNGRVVSDLTTPHPGPTLRLLHENMHFSTLLPSEPDSNVQVYPFRELAGIQPSPLAEARGRLDFDAETHGDMPDFDQAAAIALQAIVRGFIGDMELAGEAQAAQDCMTDMGEFFCVPCL